MKIRSDKKIELLVLKAFPCSSQFREEGYDEVFQAYGKVSREWNELRDSICLTGVKGAQCVCSTDPRLANNPLKAEFHDLIERVNKLNYAAYDKLEAVRSNLRCVYNRINELKNESRKEKA
jgi:hypothetical protein